MSNNKNNNKNNSKSMPFAFLLREEQTPTKGLFLYEWAMLIYLMVTLVMLLFCYTDLVNPGEMIYGRIRVVLLTAIAWGVYRLWPCRLTVGLRIAVQAALLAWWYADTYELNRILPNLDHVFAAAEQSLFGCQPSLLFSQACPWQWFSEALYCGYYSYFYLIVATALLYFVWRYEEMHKVATIILGAFFIYYIFFDFCPVVGPQYYYQAIGLDNVMNGNFPDMGFYFKTHNDLFPAPGDDTGFFRQFVESGAVRDGERPTAAFPSSHVGLSTVVGCLLTRLCWRRRTWWPLCIFTPLYLCLCFATVYIHAHYAIDAIAGLVSGLLIFGIMWKTVKV